MNQSPQNSQGLKGLSEDVKTKIKDLMKSYTIDNSFGDKNNGKINLKTINTEDDFIDQTATLRELYNIANQIVLQGLMLQDVFNNCIQRSQFLVSYIDKQNQFMKDRNRDDVRDAYFITGQLFVRTVGIQNRTKPFTHQETNNLLQAIVYVENALNMEPFYNNALQLHKQVLLTLVQYSPDTNTNLNYLNRICLHDPCDFVVQYNMGFIYQRGNDLQNAVHHYKLSLGIIDLLNKHKDKQEDIAFKESLEQFKVRVLSGLGQVYLSVQDRALAKYYLRLGLETRPNDPDLNNQMAVVYTELRQTSKALKHYNHAIKYYKNSVMGGKDPEQLIASFYMNMGLVRCYENNYPESVKCYLNALKHKKDLVLAYQNFLLDYNYISYLAKDPMFLPNKHKEIDKFYPKVITNYKESYPDYVIKPTLRTGTIDEIKNNMIEKGIKLNIGFVSGDFISHPVSYFLHNLLKLINPQLFTVHLFSLKVVGIGPMFPNCILHQVKHTSKDQLHNIIQKQKIDILFDMSAHTGDNRLDTFAIKPAPIQISYCGYPGSSGISSMDYHITDEKCDSEFTRKYYKEQLIFLPDCFLNYHPPVGFETDLSNEDKNLRGLEPLTGIQPCIKNGYITFGSCNRLNKINEKVLKLWNRILTEIPTARFIIKTKEFQTKSLRDKFLEQISHGDQTILDRLEILDYSDTFLEHLPTYNKMDISLDTFPYAGTTTSCESLLMGVPVITYKDTVRQYHSQNVTTSLLKNSKLESFIADSDDSYVQKCKYFANKIQHLGNLKQRVRYSFITGPVCNVKFVDSFNPKDKLYYPIDSVVSKGADFVNNFSNKLIEIYKTHKF